MPCPLPENEDRRVQALRSYAVLDTPPEVDFDALTRVAAHAFDTPAAVVGLMDADRLWFKSRLGLDVPELDRQIAFCAYAVMTPEAPLVVEDLSQDPRFRDNPLVAGPLHLRFYAGAPLVDAMGLVLGTIAVVDVRPRNFSPAQRSVLQDLATLVMRALEGRRRAILLGELAMTDHLTGIANRLQFNHTLEAELAHTQRTGVPFSLLCLDLDGFKAINDAHGHAAGDEVLRVVALRLAAEVRAEDLLARLGGDEFGVIMRHSQQQTAETVARRMIATIATPITLAGGDVVRIGVSVGLSTCTEDVDSASVLMRQADSALYQAKQHKGK